MSVLVRAERLLVSAWLLGSLVACYSSGPVSIDAGDGRVGAPDSIDASDDPCRHPIVDVRICCGEPGEIPGSNCINREVIDYNLEHCVAEGMSFDSKMMSLGVSCCEGLETVDDHYPVDGPGDPSLPPGCAVVPIGGVRCTKCGNGDCGPGENRCNCPKDCEP